MNKHFFLPTIISLLFCTNLFAKQLVLERKVTNHVQRYYDKTWFDEAGTVRLFVNEFTNASGEEKFGWAYAIESSLVTNTSNFNGEADCPLMYYIKNGRFYIGEVWTNGYTSEVIGIHMFYDFPEEDGYGLYFMFAYAKAVNFLLTYGNKITFKEVYDEAGYNKFYTPDNAGDWDLSIRTGDFPSYREYSKFRLQDGAVDGEKVWLDGQWRDLTKLPNNTYIDRNGFMWRAFHDVVGFHVQVSYNGLPIRFYEPAVLFQEYRTIGVGLIKDVKTRSSQAAGNQIAENLKAHGLWKSRRCMSPGDGTMLGAKGPNEGVITCWYGPFLEAGDMNGGLAEVSNKNLLINYEKLSPHSLNK